LLDKHIKLPKLGLVRFAKSKEINGTIKRVTIRRTPTRKYYVSILAEAEINELPKTTSTIGIDVGLAKFATLSNGVQYTNPKFFRTLEKKLADAQRVLSRRQLGSSNWNKQRIKVARIHERITNCRTDYLQKISTEIIKNHDVIGMEDLKISNMLKKKDMTKAISEVSWYQFRTMLEYKAKWYGKKLVLVDPKYTSQQCNNCGHIEKENRVSQAQFICKNCNHKDNADINASKNIEELALVS
jgi:putative transposase